MFDVVIIGSGPAGHTAALEAAKRGLQSAVIERKPETLGGVCLNEGCIPLKGLLHYSLYEKRYEVLIDRVMQKVGQIRSGLRSRLENAGVRILNGEARFISPHEIDVAGETIRARNFIVATGSSPKKIFNHPAVSSPEKLFSLERIPGKVLVIGGGVIGCEYASFLNNIGVSVDIVELMDSILFGEDSEAVRTVAREFKKKKIRLFENSEVLSIGAESDVCIKSRDAAVTETYDLIIEAIGRKPDTTGIGLDLAGVRLDSRGFIEVNGYMQTNVPHIYAAGDCIASPMLAYAASSEAAQAIAHIAGQTPPPLDYTGMPKLVFSRPQLGSVGLTEEMARGKGIPCRVYKYFFKSIGKAVVEGRDAGFIKLIADTNEDTIIGAVGVGEEMADIINELAVIIASKIKIETLKSCMHVHPSYSEIITEALHWGEVRR